MGSTIGYDSWAVDLANVGPVYPFQGLEFVMVIIAVLLWLYWHVRQITIENREIEEERQAAANKDEVRERINLY